MAGHRTRRTEYVVTQALLIKSKDIKRFFALYRDVTAARELALADIEQPTCIVLGVEGIRQELVAAASVDARRRAESALAALGGKRLGRLVTTGNEVSDVTDHDLSIEFERCEEGVDVVATVSASYKFE